jgi:hypothetical protein
MCLSERHDKKIATNQNFLEVFFDAFRQTVYVNVSVVERFYVIYFNIWKNLA